LICISILDLILPVVVVLPDFCSSGQKFKLPKVPMLQAEKYIYIFSCQSNRWSSCRTSFTNL